MSLGRVIEEMGKSLEALRQLNASAPVPMFEQAAMDWALDQLQERFPGKYVVVRCEKGIYSSGNTEVECKVYVEGLGWHEGKTFSLAFKKLVDAYNKTITEADVLQSANEAVEKAKQPSEAATEPNPIGWDHV